MLAFLPVMSLVLAQVGPGTAEERLEANQRADLDNLCGSYCVSRVLDLYHKKTDFLTLAAELQGPKLDQQTSLLELAVALRKRGIQARLVRLAPLEIPSWPHPIILHVNGNHFVVLESQDVGYGALWDGRLPLKKVGLNSDFCG
jgi:ABC-type bacteriocin/lantibiotic exporter with double-glycine peptidase domain